MGDDWGGREAAHALTLEHPAFLWMCVWCPSLQMFQFIAPEDLDMFTEVGGRGLMHAAASKLEPWRALICHTAVVICGGHDGDRRWRLMPTGHG